MSSDKGNAGSSGGPSGTAGDSSDGEEQEEPSSSSSNLNTEKVHEVLESFRQQWQRELQISPKHVTHVTDVQKKAEHSDSETEDVEKKAKTLFLNGVENERVGKLYEAIQYYRRAVQLVPDVEFRLYESMKHIQRARQDPVTTAEDYNESLDIVKEHKSDDDDDALDEKELYARFQRKIGRSCAVCLPEYEQKNNGHISCLPMEIILYIFRWVVSGDLDLRSLEMCSRVCRGFYVCARDSEIWRLACARVWGVNCGSKWEPYLNWRDLFINRPRLNFNGCYISKTTYIRHGENSFQDQFYRPWHIVEYYRYIRFFPEGKVLMLTTPEEPTQSVSHLRYRNPQKPGVLAGFYRLCDNYVTLLVKRQDTKNLHVNYRIRGRRKENSDHGEQTFHLKLQIQNHHRHKHVQLSWLRYSVFTRNRNGTDSNSTFDLIGSRFPPLWFSRVKSYTSETDSLLQ